MIMEKKGPALKHMHWWKLRKRNAALSQLCQRKCRKCSSGKGNRCKERGCSQCQCGSLQGRECRLLRPKRLTKWWSACAFKPHLRQRALTFEEKQFTWGWGSKLHHEQGSVGRGGGGCSMDSQKKRQKNSQNEYKRIQKKRQVAQLSSRNAHFSLFSWRGLENFTFSGTLHIFTEKYEKECNFNILNYTIMQIAPPRHILGGSRAPKLSQKKTTIFHKFGTY